jgi:neutral ceramidase
MAKASSLVLLAGLVGAVHGGYNVGVGRADITGPAAEIGMMGYAKQGQNTKGIHLRLYSRAFVIEDEQTKKRVAFVSVDAGMMGQMVKKYALLKVDQLYPGVYNERNVVLSTTHTHSGPAGFMQYVLFNVPNLGFVEQTMQAMVDGIAESIRRAHEAVQPGAIFISSGKVEEGNINRSPTSYEANPEEEKARYDGNTDKELTQLHFYNAEGAPLGVLNWFAVHPTSMNNTNHLISGDNKGAASQMFERYMDPGYLTAQGPFVAAFASSNLGDISPNILGPKCIDTGLDCDAEHSTCDGKTQMCIAFGPGKDMWESTRIIAERQFLVAKDLLEDTAGQVEVAGPVDFIHQWVDMTNYPVQLANGSLASTCKAALGYSFAAGTTDGPGEFDFTQGVLTGNPFWDFISGLLKDPTPEQEACHAPKPILLDTGEIQYPYAWHPSQVDTQVIRLGQVLLLAVPGEFTTMAGRRLRDTVRRVAEEQGESIMPIVAGLSNTYTHYITTFEEYQKQRYEAASTIYGPLTLQAYQQQYELLVHSLLSGGTLAPGTPPEDLLDVQLSFVPGVVLDHAPAGKEFGECILEPVDTMPGNTVSAKFISGHLRNNLMLESTFLKIEKEVDGEWQVAATDADWETKIEWHRTNALLGESEVTVTWDIPENTPNGIYRISHQGFYKNLVKGTYPYEGISKSFIVGPQGFPLVKTEIPNYSRFSLATLWKNIWKYSM